MRDGVVDIGFVYPDYTPAKLPIQAFLNSASFVSDAQRQLLKDEMALGLVRMQMQFAKNVEASLAEAQEKGILSHEAGLDPANHIENFKSNLIADAKGFEDAWGICDVYAALQKEWGDRLAGIERNDETAVLELVKEHLMSKL